LRWDKPGDIRRAGEILARGGLVAFPTETVYGLGASALNAEACRKIFAAKGRPADNPLIVHVAEPDETGLIAEPPGETAGRLIKAFWPGGITVLLNKKPVVPDEVTGGLSTVAVRCPENETARAVIRAAGFPVAAPSANVSGRPSPTRARHVLEDLGGVIDAVIDGGTCRFGVESTIVDQDGALLRPGAVPKEAVEAALGFALKAAGQSGRPKAPGMKYRHYAPRAPLTILSGDLESRVTALAEAAGKSGVLAVSANADAYRAAGAAVIDVGRRPEEYAGNLFAALRELDASGAAHIYADAIERNGVGEAVMNRLLKAASNNGGLT
jgi:L-threonylcarbamoyladenylate synthase